MNRLALAVAIWLTASGLAQAAPADALPTRHILPSSLALEAARVAMASCAAQGFAVAVAIVDRKGELALLVADPDVSPVSVELSQRKARTAALFNARSVEIGQRFQANPGFGQAMAAVDPRLAGAQGAAPIRVGSELIGAMGISGAPGGDKDEACVQAGIAAIAERLR